MLAGQPSETALRAARSRAAHQLFDQPKVLVDEPIVQILGPTHEADIAQLAARQDRLTRGMRGGVVARSRMAEDALAEAVARGVQQYVIVGAGLDTFAWRNPFAAQGLQVYEVDHPSTQAWKRQLVEAAGLQAPTNLHWVPANLEKDSLHDVLWSAGLDMSQPVFFAWLGVAWYLRREAALTTLRVMAQAPAGSGVLFDCWYDASWWDLPGRLVLKLLGRRYGRIGESWITLFDRRTMAADLRGLGFARVEMLDCHAINAQLYAQANRHLRLPVRKLFGVVRAWV